MVNLRATAEAYPDLKANQNFMNLQDQLRQIEERQQAPDHPILWGVPETDYLKFFLFQVV